MYNSRYLPRLFSTCLVRRDNRLSSLKEDEEIWKGRISFNAIKTSALGMSETSPRPTHCAVACTKQVSV